MTIWDFFDRHPDSLVGLAFLLVFALVVAIAAWATRRP